MKEKQKLEEQISLILDKAKRSLKSSIKEIEEGNYDFASSRAYYAVFYAMQSVLLTQGLTFSKHQGVISAFNQHFVKTCIFPKEFSIYINRLFNERQIGDYNFVSNIDEQEARENFRLAELILLSIKQYLDKSGFIKK
ncbi:MAG: HEPN domain-containing protein [Candidatus Sumerlaeota bacterium]|nr:HEPN domain-containing protein [Candidatus Sumerlaeota bacterium]